MATPSTSQWQCERCTFLNEASRVVCEICASDKPVMVTAVPATTTLADGSVVATAIALPPLPTAAAPATATAATPTTTWDCNACTFRNSDDNAHCAICATLRPGAAAALARAASGASAAASPAPATTAASAASTNDSAAASATSARWVVRTTTWDGAEDTNKPSDDVWPAPPHSKSVTDVDDGDAASDGAQKRVLPMPAGFTVNSLGAFPLDNKAGVVFRVWDSRALEVYVVGEFNKWQRTHKLHKEEDTKCRGTGTGLDTRRSPGQGSYFSGLIPEARIGQKYKYRLKTSKRKMRWRNDPCGRQLSIDGTRNDTIVPLYPIPKRLPFVPPPLEELVIYEAHIATFSVDGTWLGAIPRLDWLAAMHINALELLPATQDLHAHSKCWGYDPVSLFSPEQQYGSASNLKTLIEAAHARGIAVIFDWVPNHMSNCSVLPASYFYDDRSRRRTDYGPRLDYSKPHVRQWLLQSLLVWLDEYNFDGVRVDSIATLRKCEHASAGARGNLIEGWTVLQEINEYVRSHLPHKILIAEDLKGEDAINSVMHYDSQWWPQFFEAMKQAAICSALDPAQVNIGAIVTALNSSPHGDGFSRVIFTATHDTVPLDRDRHIPQAIMDELQRRHSAQAAGEAASPAAKAGWLALAQRCTLLVSACLLTSAGVPMLLAGQEVLERSAGKWPEPPTFSLDAFDADLRSAVGGANSGANVAEVAGAFRLLVQLRRNLHQVSAGLLGRHCRILHLNPPCQVLAYRRWRRGGPRDDVLCVMNLGARDFGTSGYAIGAPRGGTWHVRFSSRQGNLQYAAMGEDVARRDPSGAGVGAGAGGGAGAGAGAGAASESSVATRGTTKAGVLPAPSISTAEATCGSTDYDKMPYKLVIRLPPRSFLILSQDD